MKLKSVNLTYMGGPWDGAIQAFETEQSTVSIPVWYDWQKKLIAYDIQHVYSRINGYMVYQGVFNQ